MARRVPEQHLAAIEAAVRDSGTALSAGEIETVLAERPPRRTLQNRIAILVRSGRLVVEGAGRGTRYLAPVRRVGLSVSASTGVPEARARLTVVPPLSEAGERIRAHVRAPLAARTPVGYRQEFLEGYRPDRPYLTAAEQELLHRIGQTSVPDRSAGTHARQVLGRLLIDLSWNSSRLEGNTYTLLDTQRLLELGSDAPGKTAQDARMILNHRAAVQFLVDGATEIGFTRYSLCSLHALLSRDLLPDPGACGRLRTRIVTVGGSVFEPLAVPQRIEECFDRILTRLGDIEDPFEQAFFAMVQLPYLQPFEDVNKRLSRVAANIPLVRENLAPLSFSQVSRELYVEGMLGVYELNRVDLLRDVFVHAYRRSAARYVAVAESTDPEGGMRVKYRGGARRACSPCRQRKDESRRRGRSHINAGRRGCRRRTGMVSRNRTVGAAWIARRQLCPVRACAGGRCRVEENLGRLTARHGQAIRRVRGNGAVVVHGAVRSRQSPEIVIRWLVM